MIPVLSLPTICQSFYTRLLKRKFVQDVGVLTVAGLVGAIAGLVQSVLVARWLAPQSYGVAALAMSYPNLLFAILDARSAEATVKYLGEFSAKGFQAQALAICKLGYAVESGISSLVFLIVIATAWWAEDHILHTPDMAGLIVIYAAAFVPASLGGTSRAILATQQRFRAIAWVEALSPVLRSALAVGLVMAGWGIAGLVWGNVAGMVIQGVAFFTLAYAATRQRWGRSWLSGDWQVLGGRRREILGFLFYNDLNSLLAMVPKQLDVVLLGYFRHPSEVGYYQMAKSLSSAVGFLVAPLQSVTYPDLARLWGSGNKQVLQQKVHQLALQVGLPLGATVLVGLAFVPLMLPLLLGEGYRPAVVPTQLLLAGAAVWLTLFWLRPLYLAQGNLRVWTGISISVVCLTAAGFLVAIPLWGYVGLAAWLMLMHMLGHALGVIYLRGLEWRRTRLW